MSNSDLPATSKLSWVRFAGIGVALAVCAGAQWYIRLPLNWPSATPVFVGAAVLAALLLGKPNDQSSSMPVAQRPTSAPGEVLRPWCRAGWGRVLGALIAALGCGATVYASYLLSTQWVHSFTAAAPLAIAGVAVWSGGLALWQGARRSDAARLPMLKWERFLLLAIVALGFFLRFYRYDYFPPPNGVCAVEEPQAGMWTHAILHEGSRPWEFVGDRWLPVPFFALFGETLTTLRIPFTIVSGLTVLALYLLLRQLVSRGPALFATALFAVCSWHLIYARLAHAIFATTLVVIVILCLCVRAHRGGRLGPYPWIGFLSAYTLYTYAGYRGTTLFVVIFFTISLGIHVRAWRHAVVPWQVMQARRALLAQVVGLALAALAFATLVFPLLGQLRSQPAYYFEAANRSLVNETYYTSDVRAFINQRIGRLWETAAIFNHTGDTSFQFNVPGEPMLDAVTGVLMLVGLAYCVIWWRHRWQGFFAFMFLLLLILGTTFVQNLDVRRLQGIIPLIFVLIAFSAERLREVIATRLGRRGRAVLIGAALVVFAAALRNNCSFYFGRMMSNATVRNGYENHYTADISYLHTLPPSTYVLLVGDTLNLFMPSDFAWLRGHQVPGSATVDLAPLFTGEAGPWVGRDLRVVIENPMEREALMRLLQDRFPGTRCGTVPYSADLPNLDLTSCQVPLAQVPQAQVPQAQVPPASDPVRFEGGVRARYFRGDAPEPFLERVDPVISYAFTPRQCMPPQTIDYGLCRAEWEGTWEVPQAGKYQLRADVRVGDVSISIDGQPATGPVELNAGPHLVSVRARYRWIEETGTRLWWNNPASRKWELVRFGRFEKATAGLDH